MEKLDIEVAKCHALSTETRTILQHSCYEVYVYNEHIPDYTVCCCATRELAEQICAIVKKYVKHTVYLKNSNTLSNAFAALEEIQHDDMWIEDDVKFFKTWAEGSRIVRSVEEFLGDGDDGDEDQELANGMYFE